MRTVRTLGCLLAVLLITTVACSDSVAVRGRFLDGSEFSVTGVQVASGQEPVSSRGLIVLDVPPAEVEPLGSMVYSRVAAPVEGPPSVAWQNDQLRITAGPWFVGVTVSPEVIAAFGRDDLADSVRPSLIDGYLVIDLAPPLRFQNPWEIKGQLMVEYDSFTVLQGCDSQATDRLVETPGPARRIFCSSDGNLTLDVATDTATGNEDASTG